MRYDSECSVNFRRFFLEISRENIVVDRLNYVQAEVEHIRTELAEEKFTEISGGKRRRRYLTF